MVAKECHSTTSPTVEVGEIDTRAPFQSVKDAVSLFGGAFSGEKPSIKKVNSHSAERVLAKETQLHLAEKEVTKLKDRLKIAETTKAQALMELEQAKRAVADLTQKLNTARESKYAAITVTEAANDHVKKMKEANCGSTAELNGTTDLESARVQYMTIFAELDSAKQELMKIRQESDKSLEAKLAAINQAAEAEHAVKVNLERVGDLSKEISALQDGMGHVKFASLQEQQKQARIFADKEVQEQDCKATLEASAKSLLLLKTDFEPELVLNLERKLTETVNKISSVQQQMESAKSSDLDSVKAVTVELDGAKESLQKVAEEESSLRSLLESLKMELENMKEEHSELREKEAITDSIAGNLHMKICEVRSNLEAAVAVESKARGASEEMISTLHQLFLEADNACQEAEDMKTKAREFKRDAEITRSGLEEAERKLRVALEEAEEAKLAESSALDQIKTLSERRNAMRASVSEPGANITISREEFEALSRKVEESDSLAEMKVAAALAQVEAIKASENEALKRLEAMQKEVQDTKALMAETLKRAEMAEAAKKAVECELRSWHEREQKKATETASCILEEAKMSKQSSTQECMVQNQNQALQKVQKLERTRTSAPKRRLLPNLSGIFNRKKNQVEGGSPSYLPGENPL